MPGASAVRPREFVVNAQATEPDPLRIGAVSFLNALPLIVGLDGRAGVSLTRAVPSALPGMLENGALDVALVPVIDTVRGDRDWGVVSDACIGCDGATLTVRIFSRVDPADIRVLRVDGDSHSSVALASVLWREKYGRELEVVPFRTDETSAEVLADCQAVLLIGDKVINPPSGLEVFSTQVDLGATWKSLTGLPFVFAVWAVADASFADRAAEMLEVARDAGVAQASSLADTHAEGMGWPVDLARRYLTEHLTYTLDDRHREGMRMFLELSQGASAKRVGA